MLDKRQFYVVNGIAHIVNEDQVIEFNDSHTWQEFNSINELLHYCKQHLPEQFDRVYQNEENDRMNKLNSSK